MPTWLDKIIGGGVGDLVQKVVGTFKLSPETQAELTKQLEEHKFELAKIDAELQEKAMDIQKAALDEASANIQTEEKSEDPFVRRARPAFLWVMTICIGMSLLVFPLINVFTHKGLIFPEIPGAYLELFGVGFLGYTGARSWEKVSGAAKS